MSGFWQHPWVLGLLSLSVVSDTALWSARVTAVLALAVLAVRRGVPGWPRRAALAALVGVVAASALMGGVLDVLEEVPGEVTWEARAWIAYLGLMLALAVLTLARARLRRRLVVVPAVVAAVVAAAVGVNATFGILTTVGALIGKPSTRLLEASELPRPLPSTGPETPSAGPLADRWVPPAGMPAVGQRSTVSIPGAVSGFPARPAGLYLPPAALVPNPPRLPVIVFMMGFFGTPETTYIGDALDKLAAQHRGLAPIVVVADQQADPGNDTLCRDTTTLGRAETYINVDVTTWIKANLRVSADRRHWTVGGYSMGGLCAMRFGALYPDLWGNVLDHSGEEFPGSDNPDKVVAQFYGGDRRAYDAERLPTLLAARRFSDTWAVVTASSDDEAIAPGARRVADAARGAGMVTRHVEFASGGHGRPSLIMGLEAGLPVLYPRWDLVKGAR